MSTAAQLAEMQARLVARSNKIKGYLDKKSGNVFVGYQQRYFLVMENFLVYFKDESLMEQKGKINIYNIKQVQKVGDTQLTIDIGDRIYNLRALEEAARDDWVGCLNILQEYYQFGGQLSSQSQSLYFSRWKQLSRPHRNRKPTPEEPMSDQDRLYRSVFKELSLNLLYQDYVLPLIKNRLVIHKFKEGFYFSVSCKSLVNDFDDELILPKDYIEPLDFNMLYAYQRETGEQRKLFHTGQITVVNIVDSKYLRINQLLLTFEGEIQEFVNKIKASVPIGKEYYNTHGLKLNKNVDMTLKIYDQSKSSFDKSQKLKTKFQIQYTELIEQYDKSYRKQYTSFSKLLQRLLNQITDFINACKVKTVFRSQVVKMYVQFMHNKIYTLLRNFWNDNHEMILNINILKLANWTIKYNKLLHPYVKDDRVINGTKILIDIFFRNANQEIVEQIQQIYSSNKFYELSVTNCTKLPFELCKSLETRIKQIQENFDILEVIQGIEQLLKKAISAVVDCVLRIVTKEKNVQFLAALCNDVWIYKKDVAMIKHMKLEYVDRLTYKMQIGIINRIVFLLVNQIQATDVVQYCKEMLKLIKSIKDLHSSSLSQLQTHAVKAVNNIYVASLLSKKPPSDKILEQVQSDLPKFSKFVEEVGNVWQPLANVPNCISRILASESNSGVLQACIQLNELIDNMQIGDLRYLLTISKHSKENVQKTLQRIFQKKERAISVAQSTASDIFKSYHPRSMQPRDLLPPRQSTLTMSLSGVTKAALDGYLQFKDSVSKAYKQRFFRYNDCCLKWYHSATSHQLINRIELLQIQKIELYIQSNKFKIEKRDGSIFKFKASSEQSAAKWVDELSKVMSMMVERALEQKHNANNQELLFKDYFTASECSMDEESHSQRLLSAMSMVSTDRNREQSSAKLMKNRQYEIQQPKPTKKSWFRLGCLGFQ